MISTALVFQLWTAFNLMSSIINTNDGDDPLLRSLRMVEHEPPSSRSAQDNSNARSSSSSSSTMIVMSDSRSLEQYDYHSLAHAINSHYARLHGYRIRFVHTPCLQESSNLLLLLEQKADEEATKRCISCVHETLGGRMAPWCKLQAINETMHRFENDVDRIVYMDSDAIVARLDEPFKEEYFRKPLNMFWNKPWEGVCTGIQLWQNTEWGREMIDAWWKSDAGDFNTRHDYEQSVFRIRNAAIRNYKEHIGILKENVRENQQMDEHPFFRHITIKKDGERLKRMQAFMVEHNISTTLETPV